MGQKYKIMIVEDDAIIGNHLQRLLVGLGYLTFGPLSTGEKAVEEVKNFNPDLILMDINLEGKWDGVETASRIHTMRAIPVIYITAFADEETLKRAKGTDPYGYLLKPFDERILQITMEMSISKYHLQQEIQNSENKFRTVVEKLSEGIGIMNNSNAVTFSNPALAEILGIQEKQLIGKQIRSFMAPSEWNNFQRHAKNEREDNFELEITRPDNQKRQTLCSVSPWQATGAEVGGVYFVLRDITETKKVQTQEKEQRFLAEALRDIAGAINKSLNLEEVFRLILENIGKAIPHQSSNIMEIHDDRVVIRCSRGYEKFSASQDVASLTFKLDGVPSFMEAASTGRVIIEGNTETSKTWVNLTPARFIRSSILAPIMIKGRAVGFINLDSDLPNFFDETDAQRLAAVADQAAIAIENAHLYKQMQVWAVTDELTGIWNRRGIIDYGQKELNRAIRYNHPLVILWVDFDNFKDVNDSYGHQRGDQILQVQVQKWKGILRDIDMIGRLGGDEFVIVLPETDLAGGILTAERIRSRVVSISSGLEEDISNLTTSIGVVALKPGIKDFTQLLSMADTAMYKAKQLGKNQVASL